MAGNSAEMKVKATMDNSDLKKKSKESKEALRDFAKVGEDVVSSLGNAFGVNIGKVGQFTNAIAGLGAKLQQSGNDGVKAFGKIVQSIGGATAGLAGLGIGAAVAGFKLLNEEATAFKNTVAGANIELQTSAYISTYKQALHDANRAIGEDTAKTAAELTKKWNTFWVNFKFISVNTIAETFEEGFVGSGDRALEKYNRVSDTAKATASKAEAYAKRIFTIQRLISDSSDEWARMDREIAEYRRIAYDQTIDTQIAQEALNNAIALTKERYEEEAVLRGRLANMQEKMNALTESSISDIDKANQLRMQEEKVAETLSNKIREMQERQVALTKKAEEEALARKKAAEYAAKEAQSRAELAAWSGAVSTDLTNASGATALSTPGLAIPVTPVLDEQSIVDISQELEMVLTSTFDSIGTSLGGLIGDLATGGEAWSNFSSTAISAFGDMAISVGKMAISTGTATLGIKAALESLNGYVAIAAGVALVALGTAVKTGLSNIAGGGYSASSNVATAGSYSSSSKVNTAFEQQAMQIKIVGTLRGEGSQLVGVIESEQNRKNHTT